MKAARVIALAACMAIAGTTLAGCSGSTAADSSGGGRQTITFWGTWSGEQQDQVQQLIDEYNKSQSKYEVKYQAQEIVEQKMLTAMASGDVPDVVLWDRASTPTYVPKGALEDLTPLIKKDGVDMSQFYPAATQEMTIDGKIYGLPLTVDDRALFYNKKILADAGLQPPTTWDQLLADAKATTVWDGSTLKQAGFCIDDPGLFNVYLQQAGGQMLNDDQTKTAFNSPQGLEVLNFWDELQNQAKTCKQGFGQGSDPFAEGKLAMKYDGPWDVTKYDAIDSLDYGVVQPPVGPNGDKGAQLGGFALVIPTGAKHVDGAWDFIKWFTTQPKNGVEFGKVSGWVPANMQAAKDPFFMNNEHYKPIIDTLDYAQARPSVPSYGDMESLALIPQLEKFLSGETDAKSALANAQKDGDQILAKAAAGK